MKKLLRITDSIEFKAVELPLDKKEIQDNVMGSATKVGVKSRVAATHAGILTGNNTFYLPDRMKKSAHTWVSQYPKPVLAHHDKEKGDPIGRVLEANYVDLASNLVTPIQNKIYRDSITDRNAFMAFNDGKMTDKESRNFIRDVLSKQDVITDKAYQGLGYIELIINVTDPEAAQKIRDGRYLTGSVSATTDHAHCSICDEDWMDSECDHKPGDIYDGQKAFLIAGDFEYEEYSFVNRPADPHSRHMELIQDSVAKPIVMGTGKVVKDSLSIKTHHDRLMLVNAHDALHFRHDYDVAVKLNAKEEGKEGDGMALAAVQSIPGATHSVSKDIIDLHTKLHQEAKACGLDSALVLGALDRTLPKGLEPPIPEYLEEEAEAAEEEDSKKESKKEITMADTTTSPTAVVTSAGAALAAAASSDAEKTTRFTDSKSEDLEKLFNEIVFDEKMSISDEQEDVIYELMAREPELADAKLSTEKRKHLASTTFCGPGKSFPVPDCAHVTAARRLIGRYKGSGSHESILSCVSRKASAMGCGGKEKDSLDATPVAAAAVADSKKDCAPCAELEKKFNDAKKIADGMSTLQDHLKALREESKYLYEALALAEDQLVEAHKTIRQLKAGKALDAKRLSGVEIKDATVEMGNLMKLEDKQLDSLIESVDMSKIVDRLNTGLANTNPTGTVSDPSKVEDGAVKDERTPDEKKVADVATPESWPKEVLDSYNLLLSKSAVKAKKFLDRMISEGQLTDSKQQ